MPDKLLTVGMVGDEVANLHRVLAARGSPIPEAEVGRRFFGPATRKAVCDCQRQHGLDVTGEIDERTASVLSAVETPVDAAGSESVSQPALTVFGPAWEELPAGTLPRQVAPSGIAPSSVAPPAEGTSVSSREASIAKSEKGGSPEWLLRVRLESLAGLTSFAGFRVEVFLERASNLKSGPGAVAVPVRLTAFRDEAGDFSVPMPDRREIVGGKVKLVVSPPLGEPIEADITVDQVSTQDKITIKVPPPKQVVLKTPEEMPDVARTVRGLVIERRGRPLPSSLQVIVWGRPAGTNDKNSESNDSGAFSPVFVTKADSSGHFSADAPNTKFTESYATVQSIDDPVSVWLDHGFLPRRMLLVIDLPEATPHSDSNGKCDSAAMVPRTPTQEDIAAAPNLFSADLGVGCVRFNTPNRAIEEFDFYRVVRTTEPGIRGLTIDDVVESVVTAEAPPPAPPVSNAGWAVPAKSDTDAGRESKLARAEQIEKGLRQSLVGWPSWNNAWSDLENHIIQAVKMLGGDLRLSFFAQFYDRGWRKGDTFNLLETPIFDAILTAAARSGAGLTDASSLSGSGSSDSPGSASYAATATLVGNSSVVKAPEETSIVNISRPIRLGITGLSFDFSSKGAIVEDLLRRRLATLKEPKRVDLQAGNPIDWDSTPTFFEAATIAHGHLLHFKQVWYADGYSLGDLLYSLPLAPGQKKLISVIDWERRERTGREEELFGDESVTARLSRDRDLTEVVSGALSESARGGSRNNTWGVGAGHGGAMNGSYQAYNFGALHGVSGGYGESNTDAFQDASRNLSSSSLQSLRDQTLQSASAVRSLRSTIVQTVAQGEAVRATTDVVANHNHCHAMTIQYFEVLRHLQVTHELADVQECLFVPLPMKQFDLSKTLRWRQSLSTYLQRPDLVAAFDAARRVQTDWTEVMTPVARYADESVTAIAGEITLTIIIPLPPFPEKPKPAPGETEAQIADKVNQALNPTAGFFGVLLAVATGGASLAISATTSAAIDAGKTVAQGGRALAESLLNEPTAEERYARFQQEVMPVAAAGFVDRLEIYALVGSNEIRLQGADFTLVSEYKPGVPVLVSVRGRVANPVTRGSISSLIIKSSVPLPQGCRAIINSARLRYRTDSFEHHLMDDSRVNDDIDLPIVAPASGSPPPGIGALLNLTHFIPVEGTVAISPGTGATLYTPLDAWEQRSPRKEDKRLAVELLTHLNDNLEYYHHAIWWAMDPNRRYMLLDGYLAPNSNGRSVASVVENKLIGIVGNSLVMPVTPGNNLDPRFRAERDQNGRLLDGKLKDYYALSSPVPPSRVSLPTRGVFAEAIMGECNACEKIDDSRFWRWEESPIDEPPPLDAAAIASRRSEPNFGTPTPFPTPIVSIQNAPAAPEPAGVRAALDAITKQSFVDITGIAGTQANAAAAYAKAMDNALQFGKEASVLAQQAATLKNKDKIFESIDKAEAEGKIGKDDAMKHRNRTFENLSPPPLVEAQPEGSSPDEWAQWPEEKEEDLKHGEGGTARGRSPRIVTISVKLRVFVPSEAWLLNPKIGFNGDCRPFSATRGTSRAEIELILKLNVDTFQIVSSTKKGPTYGFSEIYSADDLGDADPKKPIWWRSKKVAGSAPRRGPTKLKDDDTSLTVSTPQQRKDLIAVGFKLRGQPYFPWDSTDLEWVKPFIPNWLSSAVSDLNNPDFVAEITVTFSKLADGVPRYSVSGKHSAFPAYEVYVNGEEAYAWGTMEQFKSVSWLDDVSRSPVDVIEPHVLRQIKNLS